MKQGLLLLVEAQVERRSSRVRAQTRLVLVPHLEPHTRRVLERVLHLLVEQVRHESRARGQAHHRESRHAQQERGGRGRRRLGRGADARQQEARLSRVHGVRVQSRLRCRVLFANAVQTRPPTTTSSSFVVAQS